MRRFCVKELLGIFRANHLLVRFLRIALAAERGQYGLSDASPDWFDAKPLETVLAARVARLCSAEVFGRELVARILIRQANILPTKRGGAQESFRCCCGFRVARKAIDRANGIDCVGV